MKKPSLLLALAGAALLGATSPALPATITADEFVARVVNEITAGELAAARADLLALQHHGFAYLRIGPHRYDLETLIDLLRGRNRPDVVLERLTSTGAAQFEPCEPLKYATHVNLDAPGDLFPAGSAGCEV